MKRRVGLQCSLTSVVLDNIDCLQVYRGFELGYQRYQRISTLRCPLVSMDDSCEVRRACQTFYFLFRRSSNCRRYRVLIYISKTTLGMIGSTRWLPAITCAECLCLWIRRYIGFIGVRSPHYLTLRFVCFFLQVNYCCIFSRMSS